MRRLWMRIGNVPLRVAVLKNGCGTGAGGGKHIAGFGFRDGNESLDNLRIELGAGGLAEAADSLFMAHTSAVAAMGNHGIVGVNDANNARHQRYVRAFEVSGIAVAIHAFVVVQSVEAGLFQTGYEAQDGPT